MTGPLLRPAREDDLDGLLELARSAAGVTTLPPDRGHLAERLERSVVAFARAEPQLRGDEYVFVVEDASGRVDATSAMVSRVGGFDPFYTYEVRSERVAHAPLGVDRSIDVLHLKRDHKGPSELCSLVVHPARRGAGLGRLASQGRLLFVALHPGGFADRTIAEIRGYQDEGGRSPFWEAVGRVFLAPSEFAEADMLTGLGEKDFVEDLMPRHPIYLDLLGPEVRATVGVPHPEAVAAMRMLEAEGFVPSREVDIFDAGPILECPTARIATVARSRRAVVSRVDGRPGGVPCLVATADGPFRATRSAAARDGAGVVLPRPAADRLGIVAGARVILAEDLRG